MAKLMKKTKAGFTLIELMIVVAIIGILAALAIPAFLNYIKRSKASEASIMLDAMFKGAAGFYSGESAQVIAVNAATTTNCIAANLTGPVPDANPTAAKEEVTISATPATATAWRFVRGGIAGYVYYAYQFDPTGATTGSVSGDARCQVTGNTFVYTFTAYGDLDDDDTNSTYAQSVATNSANDFYRARGLFVASELE